MTDPTQERFVFNGIPQPQQLLPKTQGRVGVEYLQCCAHNQHRADLEGWVNVQGARPYVIRNPANDKKVTMVLLAQGRPLEGYPSSSGRRVFWVDEDVYTILELDPKPETSPKKHPSDLTEEIQAASEEIEGSPKPANRPPPPSQKLPSSKAGEART